MARIFYNTFTKEPQLSGKVRLDIASIAEKLGFISTNTFSKNDDDEKIAIFPYPSDDGNTDDDVKIIDQLKDNNYKIIIILLNLNHLRYNNINDEKNDRYVLENADSIIGSEKMIQYIIENEGYKIKHYYGMLLHDYLFDHNIDLKKSSEPNNIVYAGSTEKVDYLLNWQGAPVDVYGVAEKNKKLVENHKKGLTNARWVGQISPDMINLVLDYGVGLSFDYNEHSDDRYNFYQSLNLSHKITMYIATGRPLIINSQSPVADLLVKKGMAIAVDNIDQINDAFYTLDDKKIKYMSKKILNSKLRKKIISGTMYKNAIEDSIKYLNKG